MRKHSCKPEKAEMPLFSLASSQDTREELKLFCFFNPSALEIKSPQTKAAHKDDPGASGQGLSQTNQSRSSLLYPTEDKLHSAFFWPLGGISIRVRKACVQTGKGQSTRVRLIEQRPDYNSRHCKHERPCEQTIITTKHRHTCDTCIIMLLAIWAVMVWAGIVGRPEDWVGGNCVWLKEGKPGV